MSINPRNSTAETAQHDSEVQLTTSFLKGVELDPD